METDSESSLKNPDIKLVTIDIKIQIRTLPAKVTFLQETDGMTEEIERMMTQLTALWDKGNSLPTTRLPAPAATTVLPKLLLKAETVQAHSEYTSPDWKHLLIIPGDIIIAYAYINEVTAIGFNMRTNLGGRFSINITKKVEPQPHEKVEIFYATDPPVQYGNDNPSSLVYITRQYIKVYKWEKDMHWDYGFNLSTLAMGRFDIKYRFKKFEWHEET